MTQPTPFDIVDHGGVKVASNGVVRLSVPDAEGRVFLRRGIAGIALKPPAEVVLPKLNELAGELLARMDMPGQDLIDRLTAILGQISVKEPQRHEWAVAELDGVRAYTDGVDIILTKQDLQPC